MVKMGQNPLTRGEKGVLSNALQNRFFFVKNESEISDTKSASLTRLFH